MITRIDVYVGGPSSCEYEITPVNHESNIVAVRRGYLCVRRVTLHRFNTMINIWGFFDPVPAIWNTTTNAAFVLFNEITHFQDFAVAFNVWRDSLRQWKVDPSVSEQCEADLLAAIAAFPNRWLARVTERSNKNVGTQVPGKT